MSLKRAEHFISEEDYLQGEQEAETRHELINGEVYAMAGANENHNLVSGNVFSELKNRLKGSPCKTFMSDMKVKASGDFFYPDVMVVCEDDSEHEYYKSVPILIIEVLSESTRKFDKTHKRLTYQNIPSLEEYAIIEQERCEIEVFRRKDHWQSTYYYLGDDVYFASLDVSVSVEDIYYQVDNADIIRYFAER